MTGSRRYRERRYKHIEEPPSYVPGMLTEVLGWQWIVVEGTVQLHLLNPVLKRTRVTACGMRYPKWQTRDGVLATYQLCEICIARNGGVS